MLTLKECRKLADPKSEKYTDEELKLMLEFLTELASGILTDLKQNEYETTSSIDVTRIQ
jgi:hypothetical protein